MLRCPLLLVGVLPILALAVPAAAVQLRLEFDVSVDSIVSAGECGPPGDAFCPFLVGETGLLTFDFVDTGSHSLSPFLAAPSISAGVAETGELWGWRATASTGLGSVSMGSESVPPPDAGSAITLPQGVLFFRLEDGATDRLQIFGVNAFESALAYVDLVDATGSAFSAADLASPAAVSTWLASQLDVALFSSGQWSFDLLDDGSGPGGSIDVASGLQTVTVIPEPGAGVLLTMGLVVLAGSRGRASRTRRHVSGLLVTALVSIPLLGACTFGDPGEPVDELTVPESNREMMEEQQEEIRDDSNR